MPELLYDPEQLLYDPELKLAVLPPDAISATYQHCAITWTCSSTTDLVSLSLKFATTRIEHDGLVFDTISGLWLHAPNLERLSLTFTDGNRLLSSYAKQLEDALMPIQHSRVHHLCIFTEPWIRFRPTSSWYCNLSTLYTDSLYWNWQAMSSLTCLHLVPGPSPSRMVMMDIGKRYDASFTNIWRLLDFKLDLDYPFLHGVLHVCPAVQKRSWLHSRLPACCSRSQKNQVLVNRHIHRIRIKWILLQAARRASPSIGDSIRDLSTSILRLLRLV